jgi:hypothetical protein
MPAVAEGPEDMGHRLSLGRNVLAMRLLCAFQTRQQRHSSSPSSLIRFEQVVIEMANLRLRDESPAVVLLRRKL